MRDDLEVLRQHLVFINLHSDDFSSEVSSFIEQEVLLFEMDLQRRVYLEEYANFYGIEAFHG